MDKKETKLSIIEKAKTEEIQKSSNSSAIRDTNPIMKRALEFHKEKIGKFSVKDLFRK